MVSHLFSLSTSYILTKHSFIPNSLNGLFYFLKKICIFSLHKVMCFIMVCPSMHIMCIDYVWSSLYSSLSLSSLSSLSPVTSFASTASPRFHTWEKCVILAFMSSLFHLIGCSPVSSTFLQMTCLFFMAELNFVVSHVYHVYPFIHWWSSGLSGDISRVPCLSIIHWGASRLGSYLAVVTSAAMSMGLPAPHSKLSLIALGTCTGVAWLNYIIVLFLIFEESLYWFPWWLD